MGDLTNGKSEIKEKALIKIIVLGTANVGKTSIMERYDCGVWLLRVVSFQTNVIDLQRESFLE